MKMVTQIRITEVRGAVETFNERAVFGSETARFRETRGLRYAR
jgi:hypothetical protein